MLARVVSCCSTALGRFQGLTHSRGRNSALLWFSIKFRLSLMSWALLLLLSACHCDPAAAGCLVLVCAHCPRSKHNARPQVFIPRNPLGPEFNPPPQTSDSHQESYLSCNCRQSTMLMFGENSHIEHPPWLCFSNKPQKYDVANAFRET